MAARSNEVGEQPFARTLLDTPVVLFRQPSGAVVAMLDRCPHRFAPLSAGKVSEGRIKCGYHGLEFDALGQCVHNPFSRAIPGKARVPTFATFEQDKAIWIWLGTAGPDSTDSIARLPHHMDPQLRCLFGYTLTKADYRLVGDNLMDLSHTMMLHPAFGGMDYVPKFSYSEEPDGTMICDYRIAEMPHPSAPAGTVISHWDRMRWNAPGTFRLESRSTLTGSSEPDFVLISAHILTPETSSTSHYFWSSAVHKDDSLSDGDHMAMLVQAFDHEDKPMLEAVHRRMGANLDLLALDPILLPMDAGSIRLRRKLQALIARESNTN
jgi:vanillate O-demethylase monooxygenase subunit